MDRLNRNIADGWNTGCKDSNISQGEKWNPDKFVFKGCMINNDTSTTILNGGMTWLFS